jgi:hypothetical protein
MNKLICKDAVRCSYGCCGPLACARRESLRRVKRALKKADRRDGRNEIMAALA